MQSEDKLLQALEAVNNNLTKINSNMLKVFWIVAVFALLYFGLILYLLVIKASF